jgi:hypothetical protein
MGSIINNLEQSWIKYVGVDGNDAKDRIIMEHPELDPCIVPRDVLVTEDYCYARVRIFVDEQGKVVRAPRIG